MKDMLDKRTLDGVAHHGDAATAKYYEKLRERKLQTTRCDVCGEIAFPPRDFCPECPSRKTSWVDLPTKGTLYAFTQQDRSVRFMTPEVVGIVELEGVGRIFTHIKAKIEDLSIGDPVELEFVEVSEALVLHAFKPIPAD